MFPLLGIAKIAHKTVHVERCGELMLLFRNKITSTPRCFFSTPFFFAPTPEVFIAGRSKQDSLEDYLA